MKKEDLGYIAGIVDGEGCIGIKKDSRCNSYQVRIQITNTDLRMIYFVKDRFGGSVRCRGVEKLGWKTRYDYSLCGNSCAELLSMIYPFLVCKKEQAKLALEFIDDCKQKGWGKSGINGYKYQIAIKERNRFRPMPATTERVSSLTKEMRQSELAEMKNRQSAFRSEAPLSLN